MIEKTARSDGAHQRDVDPSFNVSKLVEAESKYQDGMRVALGDLQSFALIAESKLQTFARESESKLQTWMRDAEAKRTDQLSDLRQAYESRIADILAEGVKDKSNLVSTQLVQIQSIFDLRVSKLEEFRLLSTGRSSVADPALAATLEALGHNITGMQLSFSKTMNDFAEKNSAIIEKLSENILSLQEAHREGTGKTAGRGEVIAWIAAGFMSVASIATPIIIAIITKSH